MSNFLAAPALRRRATLAALALTVAVAPTAALAGKSGSNGAAGGASANAGSNGNAGGASANAGSNGNAGGASGNAGSNGNAAGNSGNAGGASGNAGSNGNAGNSSNAGSNGNAGQAPSAPGGGVGNSGGVTQIALPACGAADLTPGATLCSGFFEGNLLNNSATDLSAQAAGLAAIGLSNWNGAIVEPQINLATSVVDFQTALNGLTWIGVHFGAGANSPSPHTPGGVTAFYRFDAGLNLDTILLSFGSASAARLYATGPAPVAPLPPAVTGPGSIADGFHTAVPEPAAWALMILGFGSAGAVLRRRRALVTA